MKTTHLLAALVAATLPLTVLAEDTAKTETTGMKGMDMGQMMSNSKDQDAELDKLVAEMNSASAEQETRRYRSGFDQTGRTAKGDARAYAEDDVG